MDKKFKIFVITAIIVLTVIMIGAVGLLLNMKNKANTSESQEETKISREDLELITLDEHINSNLALSGNNIPHIIRTSITFEVYKKAKDYKAFIERFDTNQVIVRDQVIGILRAHTYEDLMESGAQEALGESLKEAINELFETEIIQNIYFGELFVQ